MSKFEGAVKLLIALLLCPALVFAAEPKADKIRIDDTSNYYTGTNVESALSEIGAGTTLDDRYLLLDQTTPQTTVGTFTFPAINSQGAVTATSFGIGANTLTTSEFAYLDGQDQAVKTTSTPTFADITDNGLSASQAVMTDANKKLVSADYLNQAVKTTSAVTFATVDTGQGANELYDMDQNVLTTSSPTFTDITINGTNVLRHIYYRS